MNDPPTPTSETLFARIPGQLKERVDAEKGGRTLASFVVELLEAGLAGAAHDARVAELEDRLRDTQQALKEAQTVREAAEAKLHDLAAAFEGLRQRLLAVVDQCPRCQNPITGQQLLVDGRCACGQALVPELVSRSSRETSPGSAEGLLLVGALGLVLAMVLLSGKAGAA